VVSGISENAPKLVQHAVILGDRVVGVGSAVGGHMWPVSSVEGVIAAVTARLPGQDVTIKFERIVNIGEWDEVQEPTKPRTLETAKKDVESLSGVVNGYKTMAATNTAAAVIPAAGSNTHEMLLARCRDVLKRYTAKEGVAVKFNKKYSLRAIVADRVLEALGDASASVDAQTLSLIMKAYNSCRRPDGAIRAFEGTVGLAADGSKEASTVAIEGKSGGRIIPASAALDQYTASSLLQALGQKKDINAIRRVLCAMDPLNDGTQSIRIAGKLAANWPVTPNTVCYNVALTGGVKSGTRKGLEMAADFFFNMAEPGCGDEDTPEKDVATYGTMISGFSLAGRSDDAFSLLLSMKQSGIKPNRLIYNSLIKCVEDEDVIELLYDMREEGIEPDLVMYNSWIRVLCDRSKWYEAKNLVVTMESRGISPDTMTYLLLMNGLIKVNKPASALTLFEAANFDPKTRPLVEHVQIYTTAIKAAADMKDYERGLELLSRMSTAGIKPNTRAMTAVMGACMSSGEHDLAIDVYKRMSQPDGFALTMLIKAYCGARHLSTAWKLISENISGTKELSPKQVMVAYNVYLKACLMEEEYDLARDSFIKFLGEPYIPSRDTYRYIVEALGYRIGEFRELNIAGKEEEQIKELKKFRFLLFVLDAVATPEIFCDGLFYASVVNLGMALGGLPKKIVTVLSRVRQGSKHIGDGAYRSRDSSTTTGDLLHDSDNMLEIPGWECLLTNYTNFKAPIGTKIVFPKLAIQTNKKSLPLVLKAEQNIMFRVQFDGNTKRRFR